MSVGTQRTTFREVFSLDRDLMLPPAPKEQQPRADELKQQAGDGTAASQLKQRRSSQEVRDGTVTSTAMRGFFTNLNPNPVGKGFSVVGFGPAKSENIEFYHGFIRCSKLFSF